MRKGNLQNQELDRIGRKLLDSARLRHDEIERIVAAPQLFDAVKARIEIERYEQSSKNTFGERWNLAIRSWQFVSSASAVLIILAFGAFALIVTRNFVQPENQIAKAPEFPVKTVPEEIAPFENVIKDSAEIEVEKKSPAKPRVKRINDKKEKPKTVKIAPKPIQIKKPKVIESAPNGEFFALNFVGNPNGQGEALRVVRAELSRSTLFALGVNLPIENESEKIKTDLLVGTDGVARAIRFVE